MCVAVPFSLLFFAAGFHKLDEAQSEAARETFLKWLRHSKVSKADAGYNHITEEDDDEYCHLFHFDDFTRRADAFLGQCAYSYTIHELRMELLPDKRHMDMSKPAYFSRWPGFKNAEKWNQKALTWALDVVSGKGFLLFLCACVFLFFFVCVSDRRDSVRAVLQLQPFHGLLPLR